MGTVEHRQLRRVPLAQVRGAGLVAGHQEERPAQARPEDSLGPEGHTVLADPSGVTNESRVNRACGLSSNLYIYSV